MVMAVVAALLVGFSGGFLTFKIKQRWCERCGAGLTCMDCIRRAEVNSGVPRSL